LSVSIDRSANLVGTKSRGSHSDRTACPGLMNADICTLLEVRLSEGSLYPSARFRAEKVGGPTRPDNRVPFNAIQDFNGEKGELSVCTGILECGRVGTPTP